MSAYAITYGLMQLVCGPQGDRWGKRRVASAAALATAPSCALSLMARSLDLLVTVLRDNALKVGHMAPCGARFTSQV